MAFCGGSERGGGTSQGQKGRWDKAAFVKLAAGLKGQFKLTGHDLQPLS